MRRILVVGLVLALLSAPAVVLASPASASPLLTLTGDGRVVARDDPLLPPAVGPPPAHRAGNDGGQAPFVRAAAARKPTVRGELARLLGAGAIDQATHDDHRHVYYDALQLRRKLRGARRAALGAVISNLERIAAAGGLTAARAPALFETVARNRQWWANGPLLGNGARVTFEGSRIVWQFYAGEGLQIQWLGTFGKANGLWQGGYDGGLAALLDEALALAGERAGGLAWEYLFDFDRGAPPWVSGLSQGTAVQALARAATKLGEPRFLDAARSALAVFRAPPPVGVRVSTAAGAHYLIYSFAPKLRVLNAFTQALNGLHDYARLSGDAEGQALFAAGETQLRAELPRYDTGAWSRYSTRREADLHYHKLARDFLRGLCERLSDAAAGLAPAPGGGTEAPDTTTGGAQPGFLTAPAPANDDPAAICSAADRWQLYLEQPPALRLLSRRVRAGRPASVRFAVSKPSYVTVRLRRGGRTVVVLGGHVGGGVRTLRWPAPRRAGLYDVTLRARDLAGNDGTAAARLRLLRPRR